MIDLTKIQFVPSPNFYAGRPQKITHIVIHAMAGYYRSTIDVTFKKSGGYSAHYCISKQGDITQMVKLNDRAKHVVNFNSPSIGIELEDGGKDTSGKFINCQTDPNWVTDQELLACAELTASLMNLYNIPMANVIGHNDPFLRKLGNTHTDPDKYFPWNKFRQLINQSM